MGGLLGDRYVIGRQQDMLVTKYDMCMELHALRDYKRYTIVRCGPCGAIGAPEMILRLARIVGP